jgi:parallel beta-helix repeat protein
MRRTTPLLAIVALVLALTSPASATSGTLHIGSDTTLAENHYGSIVIDADDVTLDCAGFRVAGPSSDPSVQEGIVVAYRSGVTIRDCTVEGFPRGILLESSTATTVVANRLIGNGDYGLFLFDADANVIAHNEATGNPGSAYGGSDFDRNTFEHNTATGNGGNGFEMTRSSNNTFRLNVATKNGGSGFKVFDDTDWNVFDRNVANGNALEGFILYGGYDFNQDYQLQPPDHNTFSNNEVIGNAGRGMHLGWDSTSNLVTGNRVLRNRDSGISLFRGLDNAFEKNEVVDNAVQGMTVAESRDTILRGNLITGSETEGIGVWASTETLVTGNTSAHNGMGLGVFGSSGNVFTDNRFLENDPLWGAYLEGSTDNKLIGNVSEGNAFEGFTLAFGSSGNELTRNTSTGNLWEGISLFWESNENVLRANVLTGNKTSGVLVVDSSHNVIAENRATLNNWAIDQNAAGFSVIAGSSYNRILKNVGCKNGRVDAYDDHSGIGNVWKANRFCTSDI